MSKQSMILNMVSLHKKLVVRAVNVGARSIFTSNVQRKNLYDTLGVPRDASQADIKNAYFELSKLYHPDRIAATDENLAKFREVSAAYEILGNEQSRKLYDQGLIGDGKKIGVMEPEDTSDPIINFYRKRMQVKKADKSDDLDAWAKTYYAEAQKKAAKRHELYEKSERGEKYSSDFHYHWLLIIVMSALGFMWSTGFNGTKPNIIYNKVVSSLK